MKCAGVMQRLIDPEHVVGCLSSHWDFMLRAVVFSLSYRSATRSEYDFLIILKCHVEWTWFCFPRQIEVPHVWKSFSKCHTEASRELEVLVRVVARSVSEKPHDHGMNSSRGVG